MRRNILFFMGLFFFVSFLVGCESGPQIKPFGPETVVLAFGDSLTHGTGAPDGQSYPDILAGQIGRPVINVGVPGEVSAAGLKRLPDVLDEHNPGLVILCHGGNDFLRRLDEGTTARNLRAMITLIRSGGADVVLIGVPKLGFGLKVPIFYEEIAKEQKVPFEGGILVDLLGDNDMKSDAIHPNATGYRLMAEAVQDVINKAQRN